MGTMRTIGPPARFSSFDTAGSIPRRGWASTTEVLREGGLADGEIERLYADGVIFDKHAGLGAVG